MGETPVALDCFLSTNLWFIFEDMAGHGRDPFVLGGKRGGGKEREGERKEIGRGWEEGREGGREGGKEGRKEGERRAREGGFDQTYNKGWPVTEQALLRPASQSLAFLTFS